MNMSCLAEPAKEDKGFIEAQSMVASGAVSEQHPRADSHTLPSKAASGAGTRHIVTSIISRNAAWQGMQHRMQVPLSDGLHVVSAELCTWQTCYLG